MNALYVLGSVITLLLFLYLGYALIRAEDL